MLTDGVQWCRLLRRCQSAAVIGCRVAAECFFMQSRGSTKVARAARAKEDVRGSDMLKHPEECVAEMHCLDLRKLSAIQRAGCEHGCATDVKVVDAVAVSTGGRKGLQGEMRNKARTVLGTVVVPSD